MLQATALGFLMLALPYKAQTTGAEDGIRLLKVALSAGRHCLGRSPARLEVSRYGAATRICYRGMLIDRGLSWS